MTYYCPKCKQPGYLRCEHMKAEEVEAWNRKQKAIRLTHADSDETRNRYYALCGSNPRRVPRNGDDN